MDRRGFHPPKFSQTGRAIDVVVWCDRRLCIMGGTGFAADERHADGVSDKRFALSVLERLGIGGSVRILRV